MQKCSQNRSVETGALARCYSTREGRDDEVVLAFGNGGRMCIGNNLAVLGEWKKLYRFVVPIFH